MVLWLISAFLLQQMLRSFVLGVGVAYHLLSVYLQLRFAITPSANAGAAAHGGDRVVSTRGDAVLADRRWLWLFLIPMNLLVFGAVYAFALSGFSGLSQFMSDLWKPIQFLLDRFLLSKST